MTPQRIDELVMEAIYSSDGDEATRFKKAIITAINETKEEDAEICKGEVATGYDYPDGNDYAEAILASKIKESP